MDAAPTRAAKSASRSIRVTDEVYAELLRRQSEEFKRSGSRPSLASLIGDAVKASKRPRQ